MNRELYRWSVERRYTHEMHHYNLYKSRNDIGTYMYAVDQRNFLFEIRIDDIRTDGVNVNKVAEFDFSYWDFDKDRIDRITASRSEHTYFDYIDCMFRTIEDAVKEYPDLTNNPKIYEYKNKQPASAALKDEANTAD